MKRSARHGRREPRGPCRLRRPRLHLLVDGELAEEQAADDLAHVADCAACRGYLEALRLQDAVLGAPADLDVFWGRLERTIRGQTLRRLARAFAVLEARLERGRDSARACRRLQRSLREHGLWSGRPALPCTRVGELLAQARRVLEEAPDQ